MDGYYAIYRLSDGFVTQVGVCQIGMENEQSFDAETHGILYLDEPVNDPNVVCVQNGTLVPCEPQQLPSFSRHLVSE